MVMVTMRVLIVQSMSYLIQASVLFQLQLTLLNNIAINTIIHRLPVQHQNSTLLSYILKNIQE